MTTNIDIYRAAKLLVDRYGESATGLRILEAVEELQNTKPTGDVH